MKIKKTSWFITFIFCFIVLVGLVFMVSSTAYQSTDEHIRACMHHFYEDFDTEYFKKIRSTVYNLFQPKGK